MTAIVDIIILSVLAGLATGLGGALAVIKRPGKKLLGFLMGFSAGVMLALAFLELVAEAWELIGFLRTTLAFTAGALLLFGMDFVLPHIHFAVKEPGVKGVREELAHLKLLKVGILLAIGITIHNVPEGMAVGAGFLHLPELGILIALAIALHNIPEGIATAVPLYAAGQSRFKAFKIALFSGLSEPVGAVVAALFLVQFTFLIPYALAIAGGAMVFITLDELVPTAYEHGHEHFTALGIMIGSIIMFLMLGLFAI